MNKVRETQQRWLTTALEDVAGRLRLGLVLYPDANDRNHEVDLAHLNVIEDAIAQLELAKKWHTDSEVLRRGNIIEIAVANDTGSVSDYMKHWEARAEAAEAALSDNDKALLEYISAPSVPDAPVFCAHCEHEIAVCPKCEKAEWRIKGLKSEVALQKRVETLESALSEMTREREEIVDISRRLTDHYTAGPAEDMELAHAIAALRGIVARWNKPAALSEPRREP